MTKAIVRRPLVGLVTYEGALNARHRRMTIMSSKGTPQITVPFAPNSVDYTDYVDGWSELDRAVGPPLQQQNSPRTPKMSFTLFFGRTRNRVGAVNYQINELLNIFDDERPIRIEYGQLESGLWRITECTFRSIRRTISGDILTAEMNVTFMRYVADPRRTPTKRKPPPKKKPKHPKQKKKRPKQYTVKKNDTLRSIAKRFYNDVSKWKMLAKVNKVQHPRNPKVGSKLRLP